MIDISALRSRVPVGLAGIQCGRGWDELLLRMDTELALIDPNYTLQQAKQKYGILRIYYAATYKSPADRVRFERIVNETEDLSKTICETCGSPGKLVGVGTPQTLCQVHEAVRNQLAIR